MNLVVDDASSTAEVLADVFDGLGVERTPELAEALYTAIVTDTGRFQYSNTTPKALRLAAELVDDGADVGKVFVEIYESTPFPKLKLLARALEHGDGARRGANRRLRAATGGLRGGRGGGALLGGHHRPPPRRRRRRARRARPRAAGRFFEPPQGVAALSSERRRRLGDRARLRWWRASSRRGVLDGPRDGRDHPAHRRRVRGGGRRPRDVAHARPEENRADRRDPRRQAGRPIFVCDRRSGPLADGREDRARRDARPVCNGPADPALRPRNVSVRDRFMKDRQGYVDRSRPAADGRRRATRRARRSTSIRRPPATGGGAGRWTRLRGDVGAPDPRPHLP